MVHALLLLLANRELPSGRLRVADLAVVEVWRGVEVRGGAGKHAPDQLVLTTSPAVGEGRRVA